MRTCSKSAPFWGPNTTAASSKLVVTSRPAEPASFFDRSHRPCAAIGGGSAACSDDDVPRSALDGVRHQQARAEGVGHHSVVPMAAQPQAARGGELDHGSAVACERICRPQGAPPRIHGGYLHYVCPQRAAEYLGGALATICQRTFQHRGAGGPSSRRDVGRHLTRGIGPLEAVRGHEQRGGWCRSR